MSPNDFDFDEYGKKQRDGSSCYMAFNLNNLKTYYESL